MVDITKSPYFVTFDETKKYYRILARPGRPIQVREWNDLQEQMQKQVERVGAHLFENGAQVLPGTENAVTYRSNVGFIKLSETSSQNLTETAIKNRLLGKVITSTSTPSNVQAKVIGYRVADSNKEIRLFIDYLKADESTGATAFVPGQTIQTVETTPFGFELSSAATSIGTVAGVFVSQSVYFFNGDFILVDEQSIFLDPENSSDQTAWTNTPTAKVGLVVSKKIVTFEDDEKLGDNALLSENFGAPGADRLYIDAKLEKRGVNVENDGQFIELVRVFGGVVQERVRRTQYSVLQDTLARRTSDESGDYTVRDFPLFIKPFFKEGDNEGVHLLEEFQYDKVETAEQAGNILFGIKAYCEYPAGSGKYLPAQSYNEFLRLARGKLTLQVDPGKAYVKGYEIEKLAPSYVDIDKARQLRFQNNRLINVDLGQFVYITNVRGNPEIENYKLVEIHADRLASDRTVSNKIGTARILAVEYYSGTHGDESAVYKLYLFDVNADDGKNLSQMKSIKNASGATFTADLNLDFVSLEGSVTTNGTSSATLMGNGTSFVNKVSEKLAGGDYLRIRDAVTPTSDNPTGAKLVKVKDTPTSDTALTLSEAETLTGNKPFDFAYAAFYGLEAASGLVFNLPEQYAYTLRSANSDNTPSDSRDTTLSVRRFFSKTSDSTAGVIQIDSGNVKEEFLPYSPNDYIVINKSTGDWLRLAAGNGYDSATSTAGVQRTTATQVKIYTGATNTDFYVIASLNKVGDDSAIEKTKTLFTSYVDSDVNKSDLGTVSLGKCDILKIRRILMAPDFGAGFGSLGVGDPLPSNTTLVDITDRYTLDSGQRDYYYGAGAVNLKRTASRPTGRIRVEFDYFEHSGEGSFFSVDSYPFKTTTNQTAQIDYADIPTFTDSSGRTFNLRDCIDFRPKLTGAESDTYVYVPRSDIRLDFHHYLNRIDNLYLDKTGKFKVEKGVPDTLPIPPVEPGDSMSLYLLDLRAYTATPDDCFKRKIEHRRYTMQDIGKLEKRISNLEYYTVLSLLEKETKELEIKDAQGLDKFKNGFIVDNFKSHGIGNINSLDYKCSVDVENEELRPSHPQNIVDMVELAQLTPSTVAEVRDSNRYTRTGKLFTLKYTPKKFIEQELASQVENINPYAKFTFRGRVKLDPSTDTWRDTVTLPKLEMYDDTAFKAAQAGVNPNQVIWGEWETLSKVPKDKKGKRERNVLWRGPNKPDPTHRDHNWPEYVQYSQEITTTTTTKQIRSGIKQEVVPTGVQTQSLGKRIVGTFAADYMRSREINIEARGFLPGATLYPFFDEQSVAQFCKPNTVGANYGDLIKADDTGSVDLTFKLPAGRFMCGERIFKLTVSQTNAKNPAPISEGESRYYAVGWIDQEQETELSIRQFEIAETTVTDRQTLKDVTTTTKLTEIIKEDPIAQSFTIKEKGGCFLLAVDVYFYTKDPVVPVKLQLRPLSDTGLPTIYLMPFGEVIKPAADVVTNFYDPETQRLTITGNGTKVGYTVGPWSTNFDASLAAIEQVQNADGNVTQINNGESFQTADPLKYMIPTRFVFESPIYLKEKNDYAIVLLADSVEYQTWVCQSGPVTTRPGGVPIFGQLGVNNTKLGTNVPVQGDNFLDGVFYRSSNGTTWNDDQNVDMKFALHKAEFITNDTATIEYVNDEIPTVTLGVDPLETLAGKTKVRVYHKNHGHPAFANPPARVVIKNVSNANGLDISLLTRDEGWSIESVELDSYVIDVKTNAPAVPATSSGRCGGVGIVATEDRAMDVMFFNANIMSFPDTSADWLYQTTNGGSVSYADPNPRHAPFQVNPYAEMLPNTSVYFPNQMTVSSKINETNANDNTANPGPSKQSGSAAGSRKTLRMKAVLRSTNSNLSPAFDADRLSVFTITNRINRPQASGEYSINTELDAAQIVPTTQSPQVTTTQSLIYFYSDPTGENKGKIKTDNADIAQHLSKLDVGKAVTISGASVAGRNKTDIIVTKVTYTPESTGVKCAIVFDTTFGGDDGTDTNSITIVQKERFIDEIAPLGGSAEFKYLTRQLTLARQSTALHISFDANRPESHDLDVYYRILRADSKERLEDVNWTKAEFNIESGGALAPAYPNPNSFDAEKTEYTARIESLPPFTGVAVKIVGRGGNSAIPPRISNLKVIALDE